jgi:hypothetical protein
MSSAPQAEASRDHVPDISKQSRPLPSWLADRVPPGEDITWVYGPRFNPSWERYVTHPGLFLGALGIGVAGWGVAWSVAWAETELLVVMALVAGILVLGSVFVLGIANGYFTRLVVTNHHLLILQGYEVCRSWSIHRLPRSLIRYVRPGDGPEKLAVDLDAVKRMLGGSSDKFAPASAILSFGKRVEQIKAREDDRP